MASRLDYEFPLIINPWWGNLSTLGMQGILFYDWGKVWSNEENLETSRRRHNAGFGIRWGIDTVALFQTPLRVEVAFPIDDPDFDKPQFIFGGVLSFF